MPIAAAVVAGLNAAQPGLLNVIALEGVTPALGKTTAVTKFLAQQQEGYCFLYVSPRVVNQPGCDQTSWRETTATPPAS